MGVVFRATDACLERQVALKMLPPETTARGDLKLRILREARAAATLNHPNVCAVYDVDGGMFRPGARLRRPGSAQQRSGRVAPQCRRRGMGRPGVPGAR
jgi:serine/threonine protein kinase